MSDGELIRPHDPFSGHADPEEVPEAAEPEEVAETPPPAPEPAKKAPAKKVTRALRRRRGRAVPTQAEVEAAARAIKP